ncbi:DUF6241 domain-containing protein [Halalkalibacter alkalisediminis]|uniref:DUF6241 domain-containing protein n=1 Tax=Halalkalibacter alkalisediminis TaxID=935616 RepID=A0ABV6NJ01_9BACI
MVIHANDNSKNRSNIRVEENEYINETTYLGILSRWSIGDFSREVHDYDSIWQLQGGTIGKSTGLDRLEAKRGTATEF